MLLIHIGFFRTASTFLQKRVFPIIDDSFKFEHNLRLILDNLVYANSLTFNQKKTIPIFKEYLSNKKIKILSYECLSGHPYSGGINQNEILQRLKVMFPNSSILIIFREQRDHIKSIYKKYIREGGKKKIDYFLDKKQSIHNISFKKRYLNYFDIISKYKEKFGNDKVLALPFELLKYEPINFVSQITDFLDIKINIQKIKFEKLNESSKFGFFEIERLINKIHARDPILDLNKNNNKNLKYYNIIKYVINSVIPDFILKKTELRLEQKIDYFCKNYFCLNNLRLQKELKLDLKKYGYKLR